MIRTVFAAKAWIIAASVMVSGAALLVVSTHLALTPAPETLLPEAPKFAKLSISDRNGMPLSVTYQNSLNYHDFIPIHALPPFLREAFVLSEDKRFYQHDGVDWLARLSAALQNIRSLKVVRGASTITEQAVRILRPRKRSLWARWLEGWEASRFERRFSKNEILEFYLNEVPYGSNRRGVQQAARYYFNRDLSTLNKKEMLALVVLVRAPSRLNPYSGGKALDKIISNLCRRIAARGYATKDECTQMEQQPLELGADELRVDASQFVRFVSSSSDEHSAATKSGRLITSLDSALQKKSQELLEGQIARLKDSNVRDGAMVIVDNQSGEILAWVNAGKPDEAQEGSYIDAVLAPRQPGSTLKPFLYALALEKGWTAAEVIEDSPLVQAVGSGAHSYRNYSRIFYGPVRLRDALGNSLNTPAIRTVQFVGASNFLDFLRAAGFKNLIQSWQHYGEGLALGNGEVSLYELVRGYAMLARQGRLSDLTTLPLSKPVESRRMVRPQVAAIISDILSDSNARRFEFGRSGLLTFSQQVAVKTGTSSDFRDLWALAYSRHHTVGIWMGNLDRRPMRNVTSTSGPGLLMRAVFHELERYAKPKALARSENLRRERVCSITGLLASHECPAIDELFEEDAFPERHCNHSEILFSAGSDNESGRATIAFPTAGLSIARDPRIPDSYEAITFSLKDGAQYQDVTWFLDGAPLGQGTKPDNKFSWGIAPGRHTVWAVVREAGDGAREQRSNPVNFMVK
ncbi:MAG: transglycosylase domain-containing protein [Deltaproteobacteria bacterium]|nr:transglycosylase domain-containing protein [Deltaproteobacteria bacterium]